MQCRTFLTNYEAQLELGPNHDSDFKDSSQLANFGRYAFFGVFFCLKNCGLGFFHHIGSDIFIHCQSILDIDSRYNETGESEIDEAFLRPQPNISR